MELKILGTRGNVESRAAGHLCHSGMLVDQKLLFDLGEKDFLKYDPSHVFITHLHPDHAFFMKPDYTGKETFPISNSPERSPRIENIKIITGPVHIGSYKVTAIPTVHSQKVLSCGYLIEHEEKKILYTGDLVDIEPQYHCLLDGLDLAVTDGSFMRRGGMVRKDPVSGARFGHAGIPDLVYLFSRFSRIILFMHYGEWFFRDIETGVERIRALSGQSFVGPTYDGFIIHL